MFSHQFEPRNNEKIENKKGDKLIKKITIVNIIKEIRIIACCY
jgi:hypothetical protein